VIAIPPDLIRGLRNARCVVAFTGSGISAESGVPTFRDAQTGLWANFKPEELATPEAFRRNPRRVWEWYAWRRQLVAKAQPNAAHRALCELEGAAPSVPRIRQSSPSMSDREEMTKHLPPTEVEGTALSVPRTSANVGVFSDVTETTERSPPAQSQRSHDAFTLITQNVDGLHQRAGSRNVIELHGNIARTKCFEEDVVVEHWNETGDVPPRCPRCGGLLRPDVVWFNEPLPEDAMDRALAASRQCEVFLAVGTSSQVYPAASLPLEALDGGAMVIEINPDETPLSRRATHVLRGPAGVVLPELVQQVR
jgi:NAD-dependent deacetylase